MEAKKLREQADELFSKRSTLTTLWQSISENFYPERADFTLTRHLGSEFVTNLTTSYPLMCRRDLGDQLGTMLRPTAKSWFHPAPNDERKLDNDAKRWLEMAEGIQRRAMYDPDTKFTRACKEGDHDFAAFGQTVLSVQLNRRADALLYRCWHLRDVAWMENQDQQIGAIFRKWKPTALDLSRLFPNKIDSRIVDQASKHPFETVECMHMIVEADMYDDKAGDKPWWSIYYDCTHDKIIEAVAQYGKEYVIPRWQTVSGSQYAFSPATIAALPDARLIQAMTYTLLQAGEKAVNPPLVATQDVLKSDVSLYAGGITWVDMEYDERLGEALRPLTQDFRGMPISREMQQDCRSMLAQAFYLNKLTLPPANAKEMTAYETGQRVQEYIRAALPIFEPMEMDYNGGVCEETFDVLMRANAFGSPFEIPKSLREANIHFRFESPLHDLIEAQKGQKFVEMGQYISAAVALDPSAALIPDVKVALRDALLSTGVPAKWTRNDVEVKQLEDAAKAQAAQAQTLGAMEQASNIASNLGSAKKDMAQAGAGASQDMAMAA